MGGIVGGPLRQRNVRMLPKTLETPKDSRTPLRAGHSCAVSCCAQGATGRKYMDAKARTTGLAALSPGLPPAVEAFVTDLRTYFARLDVSVRAYAGRRHMDAG